ncbi:STAS domain-containing protein [Crocinitomicaceae bacterium]|nr:STAS domain-containing protein [Crocinitomicaceae bacterium]MDC0257456.1 STAS domain-containing protein [Crocinitomicaceae bacterium]|mmetsp:Transcript_12391/g.14393  ORF Transcript_12391/g.14393 Transcript_12391/m.14393 type:complete len:113 (+) Transcript_12391:287-625(+)
MEFTVTQDNGTAIIELNVERLNASNASGLKAELALLNKKSINNIVIDMSNTKYCDSSGLSALLLANRLCKDTNGMFVLCGLQDNVQKLISIAQLDKVLNLAADKDAAMAQIA